VVPPVVMRKAGVAYLVCDHVTPAAPIVCGEVATRHCNRSWGRGGCYGWSTVVSDLDEGVILNVKRNTKRDLP
jgi:hypothetical protein